MSAVESLSDSVVSVDEVDDSVSVASYGGCEDSDVIKGSERDEEGVEMGSFEDVECAGEAAGVDVHTTVVHGNLDVGGVDERLRRAAQQR